MTDSNDLLAHDNQAIRLTPKQAELTLFPHYLCATEADRLYEQLESDIAWRQDSIRVYGKQHRIPRLQSFQGDANLMYNYSNLTLHAEDWHPDVRKIRDQLQNVTGHHFNCVLLNYYRDGNDKMGWHSDNEPELGKNPVIASITLGTERKFCLKHTFDANEPKVELRLPHGSLLLMSGTTQHFWQHAVPISRRIFTPRINLTFRYIATQLNEVNNESHN